ncbi:hypothetical protein Dimus_008985 [Dionaea muscipula]
MALLSNHMQGSHLAFPPSHATWNRGIKLKPNAAMLKHASYVRVYSHFGGARVRPSKISYGARVRPFKISAFKGNEKNEAEDGSSTSKFPKKHIRTSYVSQDGDITLADFPKLLDGAVSYAVSAANKTASRSQAIHRLFRKWVTLLHTELPNKARDEINEGPQQRELVPAQSGTHVEERGEMLKMVISYFLGLDATLKIPLMIFIPLYLGINLVYGVEVSKNLTPLWIVGPLLAAFYTKIFLRILAVYIFSFKNTVLVLKGMPAYTMAGYRYVSDGRLKRDILRPVMEIKNLDYQEIASRKREEFKAIMKDKYLDYVESIWPFYYKTLRMLKKSKLL